MVTWRFCQAVALAACAASTALAAAPQPAALPVRVQVKVSADEDVRAVIRKCLENELRAVPGAQLTVAAPEFAISVIALKVVNQSKRNVGTTFSVVLTSSTTEELRPFVDAHIAPDAREQLLRLLAGSVTPLAHWVETAAASDVPRVCHSIVQSFTAEVAKHRAKEHPSSLIPDPGSRFLNP
jgi:hypothetical protein